MSIDALLIKCNGRSLFSSTEFSQLQMLYDTEQYEQCRLQCMHSLLNYSYVEHSDNTIADVVRLMCWSLYRCGLYEEAERYIELASANTIFKPSDPWVEALRGWLLVKRGKFRLALENTRSIIKRVKSYGNTDSIAHLLMLRGVVQYRLGAMAYAVDDLTNSISMARITGDTITECHATNSYGLVLMTQGDYAASSRVLKIALGKTKQVVQPRKMVHVLINLTIVEQKRGAFRESHLCCCEASKLLDAQADQSHRVALRILELRGLHYVGEDENARQGALKLLNQHGVKCESRYEPLILELLGDIALSETKNESATRYYTRALSLGRALAPEGDIVAECLRRLASTRLQAGEPFEAIPLLKEAIEACEKCGERYEIGIAHRHLSQAYRELDNHKQALNHSHLSVDHFKEMGARLELAHSLLEAARARHAWFSLQANDIEIGLHAAQDSPYTHLEEAWSYAIEAFHAYADVDYAHGQNNCEQLMDVMRRESTPVWLRKTPSERSKVDQTVDNKPFIASSPSMKKLMTMVEISASTIEPVLVTGETGTGKELIAHMVHEMGARAGAPFVPVNCAAIPESLFEREFFGHAKGAYTGAEDAKPGLCEEADGGTLFLDEIGDMPSYLQVKLLRLLQEGTYRRLGDPQERRVDLRIIAATNAPLPELIAGGKFRQDLYYRLQTLEMRIPPLRERPEDLVDLMSLFISRALGESIAPGKLFDRTVMAVFRRYPWPGNVRELEAMTRRMALLARYNGKATADLLPDQLSPWLDKRPESRGCLSLTAHIAAAERERIVHALVLNSGNRSEAARALGISRNQLYRKMEKLGIRAPK